MAKLKHLPEALESAIIVRLYTQSPNIVVETVAPKNDSHSLSVKIRVPVEFREDVLRKFDNAGLEYAGFAHKVKQTKRGVVKREHSVFRKDVGKGAYREIG